MADILKQLCERVTDVAVRRSVVVLAEQFRQEMPTLNDIPERGNADWCEGFDAGVAAAAEAITDKERRILKKIGPKP